MSCRLRIKRRPRQINLVHRSLAKVALLTLTALLCAPAEGEIRRARGHASRQQQEILDPNLVNDAQLKPEIGLNAKGPAVVRAQILLDRAHFSCGQIDGEYGVNLEKTVLAFERNRNLPVEEGVGPAAWEALNAETAPALTTYMITQED